MLNILLTILKLPGVIPGMFGGLAVPLALLTASKLPGPFQLANLATEPANLSWLFLLMPVLGGIVSHFSTSRVLLRHFMTAACAPAIVLGAVLLYTASTQNKVAKEQNSELKQGVRNRDETIANTSKTLSNPELLNGTTPL